MIPPILNEASLADDERALVCDFVQMVAMRGLYETKRVFTASQLWEAIVSAGQDSGLSIETLAGLATDVQEAYSDEMPVRNLDGELQFTLNDAAADFFRTNRVVGVLARMQCLGNPSQRQQGSTGTTSATTGQSRTTQG